MPHSSSPARIFAPVSLKDLREFFGLTQAGLGDLITAADINPWAKYKPIRRASIAFTYEFDKQANTWLASATWWKGTDGKCGFDISVFTDLGVPTNDNTFLGKLKQGLLEWVYRKPSGGALQPFRLTDFASYLHEAVNPVGEIGASYTWLDTSNRLQIDWDLAATAGSENLVPSDFEIEGTSLTDFYLGLLMMSGAQYYVVTSDNRLGDGSLSIIISEANAMSGKTWDIIPFYSNKKITTTGETEQGLYLSANVQVAERLSVYANGTVVQVYVSAVWQTATSIEAELTIYNYGSGQQSLTGIACYLVTTSGSQKPEEGQTVATLTWDNATVAGGSPEVPGVTVLAVKTFTNVTRDESLIYWVGGKADNFTTLYNQIEETPDTPEG